MNDLESIIDQHFKALKGDNTENCKIAELIKLIELHTKLSADGSGTKEFWDMLAKIRRQAPPPAGSKPVQKKPATKPGKERLPS